MGISSLNKSMNNFWTVHAISAHVSSIGAAWWRKFKTLNEITQISFYGSNRGICMKKYPNNNFLTVQPILPSIIPINSSEKQE